jgi:hypothetical protein
MWLSLRAAGSPGDNDRRQQMSKEVGLNGKVRTEAHGKILRIIIDNAAKKNSFSPQMMLQMSDALTLLDLTNDYWVGVVCARVATSQRGSICQSFLAQRQKGWNLRKATSTCLP